MLHYRIVLAVVLIALGPIVIAGNDDEHKYHDTITFDGSNSEEMGTDYESLTPEIDYCWGGGCAVLLGRIAWGFWMIAVPPQFYVWVSPNGGGVNLLCIYPDSGQHCDSDFGHFGWMLAFSGAFIPTVYPDALGYILPRLYGGGFAGIICTGWPVESNPVQMPGTIIPVAQEERGVCPLPARLWTQSYDAHGYYDGITSMHPCDDGGYFLVSSAHNDTDSLNYFSVIRTDEDGDTLWTRLYGGEPDDHLYVGQPVSDGGYILSSSQFIDSTNYSDVWIIKLDKAGNIDWQNTYDFGNRRDEIAAIVPTEGGYVVTGYSADEDSTVGFCLKVSSTGDSLLHMQYADSMIFLPRMIRPTWDGGFIILGNTLDGDVGENPNMNAVLLKLDSLLNLKWMTEYGGDETDFANDVWPTFDLGYIFVGLTGLITSGNTDIWLVRTDSIGDTLWARTYGNSSYDMGWVIRQTDDDGDGDADDGFLMAGVVMSPDSLYPNIYLAKLDSLGNVVWDDEINWGHADAGYSLWQNEYNGNYVIAGITGADSVNTDVFIAEYTRMPGWKIRVDPDSMTIQEAIDLSMNCDTILLLDGVFSGEGNRDINFDGKAITVMSKNGPASCIIDCSPGKSVAPNRCFIFENEEDEFSVLEGVTCTGGNMYADDKKGGAIFCDSASPSIRYCIFDDNSAQDAGGAIYCINYASPSIDHCTFVDNSVTNGSGGGIFCTGNCDIALTNTILWGNTAYYGHEIAIQGNSDLSVSYSDVQGGKTDVVVGSGCTLDWNISNIEPCDPDFCDPDSDYYYLYENSCCENTGEGGSYIGALPSGCVYVCDCIPGDANGDGSVNTGDAVYILAYVFQGGPPPTPYQICSGDANCDCQCNVGDVVYIINYIFEDGTPPCICEEWVVECGPPLRN